MTSRISPSTEGHFVLAICRIVSAENQISKPGQMNVARIEKPCSRHFVFSSQLMISSSLSARPEKSRCVPQPGLETRAGQESAELDKPVAVRAQHHTAPDPRGVASLQSLHTDTLLPRSERSRICPS